MEETKSIVDTLIESGRYSLWHPTSKGDLLLDYPALRKAKAFTDVSDPRKMLFVWFYACRCSRGVRELFDDKQRILYALRGAYGERIPTEIKEKFMAKEWGSQVNTAIEFMRAYQPEPRMMTVLLAHEQIGKVRKMLEANVDDIKDWKDRDNYFAAVKDGMALLQTLQPLTEVAALGVVEKTDEQEEAEGEIMEWLHEQEDLNT